MGDTSSRKQPAGGNTGDIISQTFRQKQQSRP